MGYVSCFFSLTVRYDVDPNCLLILTNTAYGTMIKHDVAAHSMTHSDASRLLI
jgi:hypothetical protein